MLKLGTKKNNKKDIPETGPGTKSVLDENDVDAALVLQLLADGS